MLAQELLPIALDDPGNRLVHCPTFPGFRSSGRSPLAYFVTHRSTSRATVILILKSDVTPEQIEHVLDRVAALGLQHHLSRGTHRTIVGIIGDEEKLREEPLRAIPGVAKVVPVLPPFKLASRDAQPEPSVIDVSGVKIGGGNLGMIAGPCSVEDRERMFRIAESVSAAGANLFRGGAFKPRTSPYAFQGLGEDGLKILREVGDEFCMPVVTEVTDPRLVELVAQYADMLQVGARNMQNFALLTEVGRSTRPVLLKRGMSATITDLLMCAEYILSEGNPNVVLCERGVKSFDSATRNLFDVAAVPAVHALSHLPIIVDPSHATGRPDLIPACALAGLAAGADGVHVEVHDCPEVAKSDGPQALLPEQYAELAGQMRSLAELLGKTISPRPETLV
jgi:3-deoxy-7-phosphoheptulonate synthase